MLARGTYQVDGQLKIAASGVVLSGAGSGENGTVIRVGGAPHRFIDISGSGSWALQGEPIAMTDLFVPAGAGSVRVKSSAAFRVGDRVLVQRPVTNAWIHFMGMDTLVRDGKPQTWIKAGTNITTDASSRRSLVIGLHSTCRCLTRSTPRISTRPAARREVRVRRPSRAGRSRIDARRRSGAGQADQREPVPLLRMNAVSDAWLRDVVAVDTQNTTTFGPATRRITVEEVHIRHTLPFTAPAAPADFAISGTQILIHRSSVSGQGVWPVVTQAGVTGPNVILNFKTVAPASRRTSDGPPGCSWTAASSAAAPTSGRTSRFRIAGTPAPATAGASVGPSRGTSRRTIC